MPLQLVLAPTGVSRLDQDGSKTGHCATPRAAKPVIQGIRG